MVLVCIDWAFIDADNEIFADFSAFYYLVDVAGQYKIIHVISHSLEQSKVLTYPLNELIKE